MMKSVQLGRCHLDYGLVDLRIVAVVRTGRWVALRLALC